MNDTPIKECLKDICMKCEVNSELNCNFNFGQLLQFYLIALPSFIIGGIGIYSYKIIGLVIWFVIIGLFFFIIEIRVLCSHCPHYAKSSKILKCWANYGIPKLWKYRPEPVNKYEKAILVIGFIVVWGYPLIFFCINKNWTLLIIYIFTVVLFFSLLKLNYCKKCINFTCLFNNVNIDIKKKFFKNNPEIYEYWKNGLK